MPLFRLVTLLRHNKVDLVIDVGANNGGYGTELRQLGYRGAIVSFEPLPGAYARLVERTRRDDSWTCHQIALDDTEGVKDLNVAGNDGASSSFLEMLPRHVAAAANSRYVEQLPVSVRRLDSMWGEINRPGARAFLKIDVQGLETNVLRGAEQTLPSLIGVQLELSLVPLYEGAAGYLDMLRFMTKSGFALVGLEPGFWDEMTGQTLQVDALFLRDEHRP